MLESKFYKYSAPLGLRTDNVDFDDFFYLHSSSKPQKDTS